jgi:hypothetical protein
MAIHQIMKLNSGYYLIPFQQSANVFFDAGTVTDAPL